MALGRPSGGLPPRGYAASVPEEQAACQLVVHAATRRALAIASLLVPWPSPPVPARPAAPAAGEARIPVTLAADGCQPSLLTAAAGRVVFEVTNGGPDVGEFEVLSGTRVVDEVENIVPGFVVNFATRLDGGDYELICYALQSPRGTLAVSGGAAAAAVERRRRRRDAGRLPGGVRGLRPGAGRRSSRRRSRRSSRPSRRATSRPPRRRTPRRARPGSGSSPSPSCSATSTRGWTPARRTSRAASTTPSSSAGTGSRRASGPTARPTAWPRSRPACATDAADLRDAPRQMDIEPRVIARGAGELIEEVAQSKLTGEEDRYSRGRPVVDLRQRRRLAQDRRHPAADAPVARRRLPRRRRRRLRGGRRGDRHVRRRAMGYKPFSAITSDDLTASRPGWPSCPRCSAELPGQAEA